MGGWRKKLVFLLIVYFAGFATAIYCLAPVPENQAEKSAEKGFAHSALKSGEFAQSFNTGLHKCIDFGKTAAQHVAEFVKQKYESRQQKDS
ncbi:MAG: hypothetical protein ACYS0I_09360 [Planctomycetota bacterium]|jgi:hypothetical protein